MARAAPTLFQNAGTLQFDRLQCVGLMKWLASLFSQPQPQPPLPLLDHFLVVVFSYCAMFFDVLAMQCAAARTGSAREIESITMARFAK